MSTDNLTNDLLKALEDLMYFYMEIASYNEYQALVLSNQNESYYIANDLKQGL